MINIIKANDILKSQNMTKFDQECEKVMRSIKIASDRGYRSTCFIASEFYDQVKEEFAKNGYRFKPTGYSGGVWQRTEDIFW